VTGADRLFIVAAIVGSLLFAAAVAFFAWRDHRAVERCADLGGVTWDSGEHCVLGDPAIVSTRGGVWGQS
jgi:hypothetical protein